MQPLIGTSLFCKLFCNESVLLYGKNTSVSPPLPKLIVMIISTTKKMIRKFVSINQFTVSNFSVATKSAHNIRMYLQITHFDVFFCSISLRQKHKIFYSCDKYMRNSSDWFMNHDVGEHDNFVSSHNIKCSSKWMKNTDDGWFWDHWAFHTYKHSASVRGPDCGLAVLLWHQ